MPVLGTEAWITSALENAEVSKALVLAGSLQRVHTGKKLVVVTTFGLDKVLREKLKEAFDLIVLIEQVNPTDTTADVQSYAKAEGFSLLIFTKCVYLSPNSMVLRNCDEIFEKYDNFAVTCRDDSSAVDSSIFVFTPSLADSKALRKLLYHAEETAESFSKQFQRWMENYSGRRDSEKLDEQYNSFIDLKGGNSKSLSSNISIANFGCGGVHPLDLVTTGEHCKMPQELGKIEKDVVDLCRRIQSGETISISNLHTDLSLQINIFKKEPIAIVGMSLRLPGGNNAEEFWKLLDDGKEGIKPVPHFRWRTEHTLVPCKDRSVEAGFLDVPVDKFDPEFFGISEKEAEMMDPQSRLLYEVAWEAFEDAMIDPHSLQGTKAGIFVGSWLQDYRDMLNEYSDSDFVPGYMGSSVAAGAAGLTNFLKVKGPCVGTESGCSSAVVAVDMACKCLRNGDCNTALACGVNLLLHPFDYNTMPMVLSPEGRCRTFDEGANGFGRAEGCVVLLLKRLSDATRDGDNIWGLIRGSGVTQEGVSKSFGTPTVHCESLAMELALKDAGVDPLDVSYIEAHGTGTPVGDPLEITAITKAYSKGRSEPLVIGSVKTNVGHTESVSGLTGIVKVILSMKNDKIPKHINFEKLNPTINLEAIPAKIPVEAMEWRKRHGKPRIAGVSSFGISGTDGHVIIQEPPTISVQHASHEKCDRPLHILKISAKSPQSFQQLLNTYENIFSSKHNEPGFADMAYSANVGRSTFNYRAVIIAKDFKEAARIIKNKSFRFAEVNSINSNSGKLCFVFSGDCPHYPKMGSIIYATSPIFREAFNKCSQFLSREYGINLKEILSDLPESEGPELSKLMLKQTSNFCIQYCLLKLWESWGVKPNYVMGHGLGEYVAAVAAGILSLEDGLMLTAERSLIKEWFISAFRKTVDKVKAPTIRKGAPKYISGMDGKLKEADSIDGDYWMRHAEAPFNLTEACKTFQVEGCSIFLELGSNPAISDKLVKNFEGHSVTFLPSLNNNDDEWATMLDSLAQLYLSEWKGEIDWKGFDRYYQRSRVPLPFYPFNRRPIWRELEPGLPAMHPLLGKLIPTAHGSTIFENRLTLKKTSFAQDHVIGNTVIFPGAGFLEMCLAGGATAAAMQMQQNSPICTPKLLQKPQGSVTLKSLRITLPLALYDTGICRLQTVTKLDQDDEMGYSVGVHRYVQSTSGSLGEWVSHATGTFHSSKVSPGEPLNSKIDLELDIDIQSIQDSWAKSENVNDFYERLPEVGLRFGPKFRSFETVWKSDKGLLVSVKIPEDNDNNDDSGYLIHPIVADAMIQATMLWTSRDKPKMKLQVPVQIGEFTWLQATTSPSCYIYCGANEEGKTICILLDDQGNHLAHMKDVDFIETTVKLVELLINQQGTAMPKLWGEAWKSAPGPMQCRLDLGSARNLTSQLGEAVSEEQSQILAKVNDIDEYEKGFYINICNLTRLFFINAMYKLGWKPQKDTPFTLEDLVQLLPKPLEPRRRYFRFFLRNIAEAGSAGLRVDPDIDDQFYFDRVPPSQDENDTGLKIITSPEDTSRIEYQVICEIGLQLSQVLSEEIHALQLLFPEDPAKLSAGHFYESMTKWIHPVIEPANDLWVKPVVLEAIASYEKTTQTESTSPILRVLEVGAGTGGFTKGCVNYFASHRGDQFEYHFTDISSSFFITAEKVLEKHSKQVIYKKFNIEEDPLAQGFCPNYFDVILACEVLHVAKDIRKTLRSLKCLLKPGGIFQIIETTQPDPRITMVFGLLDGYWQFEDLDFRPHHATLTPEKWEEALRGINCDKVVFAPTYNNVHSFISAMTSSSDSDLKCADAEHVTSLADLHPPQYSWLIFSHEGTTHLGEILKKKLAGVNRMVHVVQRPPTGTEADMKGLMKSVFHSALEGVERVEGVIYMWGLSDSDHEGVDDRDRDQAKVSLPVVSLFQEIIDLRNPPRIYLVTQGIADVDGSEVLYPTAGTLHGMFRSLYNELGGFHLSVLDLSPEEEAVNQVDELFYNLWAPDTANRLFALRDGNRLGMKIVSTKVHSYEPLPLPSGSDRFRLLLPQSRLISDLEFAILEDNILGDHEIEVKVKAVSLNFRDLFTVLKPIPEFEKFNSLGVDFAGVVIRVGSKVTKRKVGDRIIGANLNQDVALPSHVVVEEEQAMALPDTITFTEGVTLPAVFSTSLLSLIKLAGMKKGDNVLIHTASGGVGLCAIQLAQLVGAEIFATAGSKRKQNYLRSRGVKHIFHSRKNQFGREILEVTNGRGVDIVLNSLTGVGFKEASLSALAKNGRFIEMSKLNVWTTEEMTALRPDVFYRIVDLPSLERWEMDELMQSMTEYLVAGTIRPIAYERFDAVNIRGALNHLQKAKHIGKIVLVMPEFRVENSKITATTPLFNEVSTYLVTGGLGGIGLEVVKWMLKGGAKHIAIGSRSPPKPEIARQIETWNKTGKHVQAFQVDIGNYDQCRELFNGLKSDKNLGFPQLRGVMHAAGVLSDAMVTNQTWDSFNHCYNPKVNGTWNLHDQTKDQLLEHFVLFSSAAASMGTPGQSNHAASNSFGDTLAAYRRSNGLPATTINWGNWGEVGVATEIDFPGVRPISTAQGILALETFLKTQTTHLTVINIESFALASKIFPSLKTNVDDKLLLGDLKSTVIINSDEFWTEVDAAEGREGKLDVFKNFIKNVLRNILKLDQDEVIGDMTEFQSLGIDSLMMLEMKNGLQNILGSRVILTANQLKDCNNTDRLANRLVDLLQGEEGSSAENNIPTMEELQRLVREDSILPEHIRPSEEGMMEASEIESVLLTGATGVLGPYLLRELCRRPGIKKIYCLIRKVGKVPPLERLIKRLEAVNILCDVDLSKVECIQGDITDDKFGLSEEEYNGLAQNVDAIINSAVRSDHIAKYWRAPDTTKMSLRTVNVAGTTRLLEFAVHSKLKHFYHASTLLCVTSTDEDGCFSEDWQDVGAFDQLTLNTGYPLSKHIGEMLCKQAVERGIPCKTFRLPAIGGYSKTGRCDYLTNHIILRWLAYLKLKCMPDMPAPLVVMAVDHCAQISLDIFFNPKAPQDVYNIIHKYAGMDQTIIGIAEEFGITIQPISFSEFVEKLKSEGEDSPLAPFRKMYEDEEAMVVENFGGSNPSLKIFQNYVDNSSNFLRSCKLPHFVKYYDELESTEVVMRRDINYLKGVGVFCKFGIE